MSNICQLYLLALSITRKIKMFCTVCLKSCVCIYTVQNMLHVDYCRASLEVCARILQWFTTYFIDRQFKFIFLTLIINLCFHLMYYTTLTYWKNTKHHTKHIVN